MKGIIVFALLLGFMGCIKGVSKEERGMILGYAHPIVDNLMLGFNEGDYEKFSKDFDEGMKNFLAKNVFIQTREMLLSKIGNFVSKGKSKVKRDGPFIVVIYKAEFEREKDVKITVSFQKYGEKTLFLGFGLTRKN